MNERTAVAVGERVCVRFLFCHIFLLQLVYEYAEWFPEYEKDLGPTPGDKVHFIRVTQTYTHTSGHARAPHTHTHTHTSGHIHVHRDTFTAVHI